MIKAKPMIDTKIFETGNQLVFCETFENSFPSLHVLDKKPSGSSSPMASTTRLHKAVTVEQQLALLGPPRQNVLS